MNKTDLLEKSFPFLVGNVTTSLLSSSVLNGLRLSGAIEHGAVTTSVSPHRCVLQHSQGHLHFVQSWWSQVEPLHCCPSKSIALTELTAGKRQSLPLALFTSEGSR
eukprot:4952734-Amphidinium_carterae.1